MLVSVMMTVNNKSQSGSASVHGVSLDKNNVFSNKKPLDSVAFSCNTSSVMSEIRKAILEQMQKHNMTIYQISKLVKGKVPQRTVYAFLTAEKDTGTETAYILMKALGLTIAEKSNVKRDRRPIKEK